MSKDQGFRLSWDTQGSADGSLQSVIHLTETICTPFSLRQFDLLGLLPPIDSHPRVLDNACGSGRQTEVLRQAYEERDLPIDITSCDLSPGMIDVVQKRIDNGNWKNVKALIVNAEELDFPPDSFTHAFMSFGIMFPSDTAKVLDRMTAALVPHAPVSFTFWKKQGFWEIMHKAAICATSDPTLPVPKFYHPSWNHSETLVSHLQRAGFKDIKITDENIPWKVESKSAFVKFVVSMPQWKVYTKDWTQEQKDKLGDCALEVLDAMYPDAEHGPIEVPMIGFVAIARKGS